MIKWLEDRSCRWYEWLLAFMLWCCSVGAVALTVRFAILGLARTITV